MPDRVDAAMHDMQAPAGHTPVDRRLGDPQRTQFSPGQYTVLPPGEQRDRPIAGAWCDLTSIIEVDSYRSAHAPKHGAQARAADPANAPRLRR